MTGRKPTSEEEAEDTLPPIAPSPVLKTTASDRHWRMGIISNPTSGSNQRKFPDICRYIERHRLPHRMVTTPAEVVAALEDFARREINLIAVNAGDGTIQAVLTALLHERPYPTLPLLALLCGGTTNMTTRDLGFHGSRIQALEHIRSWTRTGTGQAQITRRPILRVRHPDGRLPLYGLFFGAACIYKGINLFHSRIHGLGLQGRPANALIVARYLAAIAARDFGELGAARATISVDGRQLKTNDYMLILTYTLEQLIFGMQPHWGPEEGPLRLTAASAHPRYFLRVMAAMCQSRQSRLATPANGYHSHNAHEVRITLDGGFALDGELFKIDSRQGELVLDAGGQAAFLRLNQ